MNQHLKDILNVAKSIALDTASATIPGSGIIIAGVTKLVDKDKTNNLDALTDLENGIVTALNSLNASEVVNPMLLFKGIQDAKLAFSEIKLALKK